MATPTTRATTRVLLALATDSDTLGRGQRLDLRLQVSEEL